MSSQEARPGTPAPELPARSRVQLGGGPRLALDDRSVPGLAKNLLRVTIGLEDVRFDFGEPDLINRKYGSFNQSGYIDANDSLIHFLQTFRIKKEALIKTADEAS